MVSFSDPRWLWLLVALPPLALLEWRAMRAADAKLARLVGARTAPHPLLAQRLPGSRRTSLLLRHLALASLIVGASGPEWGVELVRRVASGSDVVFAVDVSASMDARDVAPSRIEEARREALSLLERLGGSRVGVVVFAGDAVRLCPLTLDRAAVRLVLESLSSGSVSEPGTDLGRGLRAAARLLPAGRRTEQAVVVWTDGEDLEQGAREAIDELGRRGVRVFAVGVGTPAGDVVPVLDERNRAVDIKRDASGAAVRSRLDERLLRDLARRTRGGYFSASRPGGESLRLLATLGGLERSERGQRLVERAVPRFPLFAAIAALLLGWELVRRRRRLELRDELAADAVPTAGEAPGERAQAPGGRGRAAAAATAALVAWLAGAGEAHGQSAWARGDRAFQQRRWAAAESLYAQRLERGTRPELAVNHATAQVRAGRREEGERALAAHLKDTGRAGQTAAYNLGTLQAEQGRHAEALRALRAALERNPDDADARFNYEWTLQRMRRPPEPKQGGGGKQPQPPKPSQPQPGAGAPQPPPQQSPQGQQAPQPQTGPSPQARRPEGMDRQQADRILGSLEQLERLEQQRLRRVRVLRERRGKDW